MRRLRAVIHKRARSWNGASFSIGEGSRSSVCGAGQSKTRACGGDISANASKECRSAGAEGSLSPTSVSSHLAPASHAWCPTLRVGAIYDPCGSGCESSGGGERLTEEQSARRKAPREVNYPPTEILEQRYGRRTSAPGRGLQFATAGFAEIAQRIHLGYQIG